MTNKIPSEIQYNNEVYTWVANEGGSLTGSDIHNGVINTAKYQKKSDPTPSPSTPSMVTYYTVEVELVAADGNDTSKFDEFIN